MLVEDRDVDPVCNRGVGSRGEGLDLEDGATCYGLFAGKHMEGVVRLDFERWGGWNES